MTMGSGYPSPAG